MKYSGSSVTRSGDLKSRFSANQVSFWAGSPWKSGQTGAQSKRPYDVLFSAAEPPMELAVVSDEDSDDDSLKRRKRVEAILFLSKAPLSPRKLSQMAHLADATEARTLVRELNATYETHGRSMRVELIAGGYRMMTRPALAPWLTRLGHLPPAIRLSTPMMETLAVVAYRQNVSRADIEAIRGVACGELLRQLMERDLVRIAGRSEELGRPYLYGTTKHFLLVFGLASIDGLPPFQWDTLQEPEPASTSEEQAETTPEDLSPNDSFSSTKESVVSTAVASVLSEPETGFVAVDPVLAGLAEAEGGMDPEDPQAVIEDEEDELYGDDDDDEDDDLLDDDDWDDDDDDDDDLDDGLDDDDEEIDDEEIDDEEIDDEEIDDEEIDDEESDDWEEVDDDDDDWEDDDDDDDDDWDDDDESADDDEDWT
ncbi:hypothetical protein CA13_38650 [Planctomycetes bacterium CA13]|uniref:Segregation and condensation protein B n=1 Tax=Novipirellula herctigrandis TaxID=2527986 RepID=A0A5C5Z4Z5_9BACT|nr:hypothetical protein CA13_38650 [Planctomycetes bacterium CA13]